MRQQRRSRCDAHEHWREAMAFPCRLRAVSPSPDARQAGGGRREPKEGERVWAWACGRATARLMRPCVPVSLCPFSVCVRLPVRLSVRLPACLCVCFCLCVRCLSVPVPSFAWQVWGFVREGAGVGEKES